MNSLTDKKENIIYLIVSFLVTLISYLVNINFREKLLTIALSESIFWLVVPILVFSIVTFATKKDTFISWKKITNYFFIISVIIVLITPTSTHGLDFVPLVKETVTIVLASLYSIVSLILIFYKSLKKE
ncbi:MAG: hypothetical protein Q8O88_06445 [bacterium]|nr:hypothetical protein [bacterium]